MTNLSLIDVGELFGTAHSRDSVYVYTGLFCICLHRSILHMLTQVYSVYVDTGLFCICLHRSILYMLTQVDSAYVYTGLFCIIIMLILCPQQNLNMYFVKYHKT